METKHTPATLAQIGYMHDHPGTLGEATAYMLRLESDRRKLVEALSRIAGADRKVGAGFTVAATAIFDARALLREIEEA
jgi:hypothetical protein